MSDEKTKVPIGFQVGKCYDAFAKDERLDWGLAIKGTSSN